jgi:hypothetical protein
MSLDTVRDALGSRLSVRSRRLSAVSVHTEGAEPSEDDTVVSTLPEQLIEWNNMLTQQLGHRVRFPFPRVVKSKNHQALRSFSSYFSRV